RCLQEARFRCAPVGLNPEDVHVVDVFEEEQSIRELPMTAEARVGGLAESSGSWIGEMTFRVQQTAHPPSCRMSPHGVHEHHVKVDHQVAQYRKALGGTEQLSSRFRCRRFLEVCRSALSRGEEFT